MFKRLLALVFGVAVIVTVGGCDEETIAKVAPDAAKMFAAAQGLQGGDLLMDQIRDRDELHDGTGDRCPYSGDGICDGAGPYGGNGSGSSGSDGDGDGDQLRLRDGSCQP